MAGDDKKSMSILADHESSSESSVRRVFVFREGNRWKLVVLVLGLVAVLIVALLLLKKKPAGEEEKKQSSLASRLRRPSAERSPPK